MRLRLTAVLAVWSGVGWVGSALADEPKPAIETALAEQYFREAQTLWKQDGGRLWGQPLDGPLLFADRKTRRVVADRADGEGRLRPEGSVFVGQLTDGVNVANTAVTWAG